MTGEFGSIDIPVLHWEQPKWTYRWHQLVSGEKTYATLEWPQAFRSMGLSSSREGRYTFKRGGFLHPYVTVRRQEFEVELAKLTLDWSGNGDLTFSNGQRYHFARTGLIQFDYDVSDQRGTSLFHLTKEWSAFKHKGEVRISPSGMNNRDLALLISLCWYLAVMAAEDSAAAGGAAAGGS